MPQYHFDPLRYPASPGCYLLKDAGGKVLYVGATVNLRRQLSVFFNPRTSRATPPEDRLQSGNMTTSGYYEKMPRLVRRIADIEVILLNSVQEGLALENSIIRRLHPPFNWATMIDGTNYTYLGLTAGPFPRLVPYRAGRTSRSTPVGERFGPYRTPLLRDQALKAVNHTYGLRTCDPLPQVVCLSYHLGNCTGPCAGHISTEAYAARVAEAVERLRAESRVEGSSLVDMDRPASEDAVYLEADRAVLLHLERGKLVGLELVDAPECDLTAFLLRYYYAVCPAALILPAGDVQEVQTLACRLTSAAGHPVVIEIPTSGPLLNVIRIARMNYDYRVKGIVE